MSNTKEKMVETDTTISVIMLHENGLNTRWKWLHKNMKHSYYMLFTKDTSVIEEQR